MLSELSTRPTWVVTVYAEMMDGLRSHYAQQYGGDGSAVFTAVSLLSTLFIANVSGLVLLIDELLHRGRMTLGWWIDGNRVAVAAFAVLVLMAHWLFAKRVGIYDRHGPVRGTYWRRCFRVYAWSTVCVFLLPVIIAIARRVLQG